MLLRCLCTTLLASTALVGGTLAAHATSCGTGYVERLDRRGDPFCVSEARDRADKLRQEEFLRRMQREWAAELIRSRQERLERQALIEQRRREDALN